MWVTNVKTNKAMKRIEGANEGQNDHMVWGVAIALHISMLKSCIWLEEPLSWRMSSNIEAGDQRNFENAKMLLLSG